MDESRDTGLHPAWWTAILIAVLVTAFVLTFLSFTGKLRNYVDVTVTSDRSGLVMESGAKVKMRGVQVGRVATIAGGREPVSLHLQIDPAKAKLIPANVGARIRATTVFGAKFVDLTYPEVPVSGHLESGQVLQSSNVSVEVNTVFENVVSLLDQIDTSKLNATLTALSQGFRGQGERIGQAVTDANEVLLALNPRSETIRADWQALKGFSDAYDGAATNIVNTLDALNTTSVTITNNAKPLDALLLNVIGLSNSGIALLAPNQQNLVNAVNALEPTTNLLFKYSPSYTCMLVGAKWLLDNGAYEATGGNGKSFLVDGGILAGDDQYRYPDNLPITGAKGGPGGKPGCGSLPIVDENWPVRQLITNTGWGTGLDIRPNPGLASPFYMDFLPVTRGVPQPPSVRNLIEGPAPGPNAGNPPAVVPAPGDYPWNAQMYNPDGTPRWNNLPPAPPPGAPKDPGPRPGSEPFVVPFPGEQPWTRVPRPVPVPAAPSP